MLIALHIIHGTTMMGSHAMAVSIAHCALAVIAMYASYLGRTKLMHQCNLREGALATLHLPSALRQASEDTGGSTY